MKISVRMQQAKHVAKCAIPLVAVCAVGVAHADAYDVSGVTTEIGSGKAPVGTVASSSMGLLAVRRVWKIIRGSI